MNSQFYKDKFERRIPVTGLFMERVGVLIKDQGGALDQGQMAEVMVQALVETGLVAEPTEDDLEYLALEINKRYKDKEGEEEKDRPPTGKGKHFAGYFSEWASEMAYDRLCFYAAGFDYAKAREYFETYDQLAIVALADEKLRLEFELARVTFEASLFGFGGGYKDTPREGESVFDLTQEGQAAERTLKDLGF